MRVWKLNQHLSTQPRSEPNSFKIELGSILRKSECHNTSSLYWIASAFLKRRRDKTQAKIPYGCRFLVIFHCFSKSISMEQDSRGGMVSLTYFGLWFMSRSSPVWNFQTFASVWGVFRPSHLACEWVENMSSFCARQERQNNALILFSFVLHRVVLACSILETRK